MILAGHYYKYFLHTNLQPTISSFMFSWRSHSTNVTWTSSYFYPNLMEWPYYQLHHFSSIIGLHVHGNSYIEDKNNLSKWLCIIWYHIHAYITCHTQTHICVHSSKEPREQLSILSNCPFKNILLQSYQSLGILVSLAYWLCIAAVDTAMIVRQWKRGLW